MSCDEYIKVADDAIKILQDIMYDHMASAEARATAATTVLHYCESVVAREKAKEKAKPRIRAIKYNDNNFNSDFGEYLHGLRKGAGLSTHRLADASGISQAYISHIECGRKQVPSPEILKKLAIPLGVAYLDLMQKAGYLPDNENDLDESRDMT